MNDGQRPRMGGRELSVADVNVQNVSQGLSAALYSGGPNPQGVDSMGDGPNSGNQSGQGHGNQGHGNQSHGGQDRGQGQGGQQGQGGHRQSHQQGGHQQGGHQQGGHQQNRQRDGQHDGQHQQPAGGNVAQTNGHGGNAYGNYEREDAQPSYAAPSESPRAAVPAPTEDQPDYPEELLQPGAPAADATANAPDDAQDGVQRTLRAPRPRMRGPRRGPRQGQGEGRQGGEGRGGSEPE
jgi:hypothetical protein